jgi:hypothetical protein
MFAVISRGIVQTLQALSTLRVTISNAIDVNIIITVTLLANTARLIRIPEVIIVTNIATSPSISLFTIANHIVVAADQRAVSGEGMARGNRIRASTRTTSNLAAQRRISIIRLNTAITVRPCRIILTRNTLASPRITSRRVTITLTHLTVREVPEANLTLIALPAVSIRVTVTLAGHQIAIVVARANAVTIARLAAVRTESVGSWRTLVTLSTHNVFLALTLSAKFIAFLTLGAGWVAVACWNLNYEEKTVKIFEY